VFFRKIKVRLISQGLKLLVWGHVMTAIPKKLLFAISDTGGGHRSAATAISGAVKLRSDATCTITDFLRATKFPGLSKAPEIYDFCSKRHVWLSNLLFKKTNSISRINTLTKMVYLQSCQHIEHELANTQPDAVIAVHPLVTGLMHIARERMEAKWPIITVVTDLVTLHASWAIPGADLYLAPTAEAANSLIRYGVPINRIVHTGFPIHPKFLQSKLTKKQARKELGIETDRFTVLLTGGGVGAGSMGEWVSALQSQCADKQILVITGNNKDLYNELIDRKPGGHLHVYRFVDNMEVMMTASDIIVTKAGPGTIMEGVAMNRPLIVTEAVGIQETGNIDYVRQNHLGYYCPVPGLACKTINEVAAKVPEDNIFNSHEDIITNGSVRIAETILQQISLENQRNWNYGNVLWGAS
jgi:UDP-N-acetylglucosamine:LPS N-acetylglucosamine transferase